MEVKFKMAHLNWHGEIVAVYKANNSHVRFYITETDKVLKTSGPRKGKCKVLFNQEGKMISAARWLEKNANALATNFHLETE